MKLESSSPPRRPSPATTRSSAPSYPAWPALAGKPVKFRFHVAWGALYAFWVTPDEKGTSYGYVGAGGPAFGGVRDVPTPE